jgi:hypothetical protein
MVSTDPEIHVEYVVKVGILKAVDPAEKAGASFELDTPEQGRLEHRICFVELPEKTDSLRFEGKTVRVVGNSRWHKNERWPVLIADRLERVW